MSRSEKRKLTRMLGLRISAGASLALDDLAQRYDISATSLAREAVIRFLEDELRGWHPKSEDLASRKSPRGRGPTKPSREAMIAAGFIGEMGRLGNLSNQSIALAHGAKKVGLLTEQHLADMMRDLLEIKQLEKEILSAVTAHDSEDDQNTHL